MSDIMFGNLKWYYIETTFQYLISEILQDLENSWIIQANATQAALLLQILCEITPGCCFAESMFECADFSGEPC